MRGDRRSPFEGTISAVVCWDLQISWNVKTDRSADEIRIRGSYFQNIRLEHYVTQPSRRQYPSVSYVLQA